MSVVTSPRMLSGLCALSLLLGGFIKTVDAQAEHSSTPQQQAPTKSTEQPDQPKASKDAPASETITPEKAVRTLPPHERGWLILHDGLNFNSTEKRVKALTALGLLKGNAEAEQLAIAELKDEKWEARAAAANALGAMHAVHARTPLEVALDDGEPAVVLAAANSLLSLKNPDFAYDIYYGVLTGTVRTNKGVVKEQIRDQMKILHDKKKIAELGLEQGLGFLPYGGVGYGMVKTLVKSDNSPVRAAAAKKLAHDPDPASGKALVAATQDKNWVVRQAALEAIAERGDRSLVPQIKTSLEDDKDEVRFTAAACVVRLTTKTVKRNGPVTALAAAVPSN
jgi:hypothetical protein